MIITCIFSDHNAMKLEADHKKIKIGKPSNTLKLKNTLPKNGWINQEIKEEIKKKNTRTQMKMKCDSPKPLGCSKGNPKREEHCNSDLSQEVRKFPNP